jgi:hypothetical protein
MKFLSIAKDGGPQSPVVGYWLIELKGLFSIVLLRFYKGTRTAYHSHAFHAISWIIKGELKEDVLNGETVSILPSFKPLFTAKNRFHKVHGIADNTWALSFRGPWDKTWQEYFIDDDKYVTLTNGRIIVKEELNHE